MKNLANIIARILLILMISVAGVYLLPDGNLRMKYIMSKIIPSMEYAPQTESDYTSTNEDNAKSNQKITVPFIQNEAKTEPAHDIAPTEKLRSNRRAVKNLIGENYLDAVLSAGKLERWNPGSFPLKVYMATDSGTPKDYVNEVYNAFSTWEKETNGFMRFTYTDNLSTANFVCNFKSDLKNRGCDGNGAGMAAYQYFTYKNNRIDQSIVNFSAYACNGQPWPKDFFYSCALHEIGHGLGLRGHSTNKSDLMYPVATNMGRMKISKADMTTLRAIYSIIPDITDVPLTAEQKKKLITTDDFYGNSYVRADFQIQQLKQNIRLTPNQYGLYIELARAYKDKQDYNNAIAAYSDSLKMIDDKNTAVAILCEVSQLYIELKKYPSAEKCLKKALSYGNNDTAAALLINMGVELGNHNNYSEATRLFEMALNSTQNVELKQLTYKNLCWIAQKSKDKVLYNKYSKLISK
ncbi:matrixin family metalloprotease [bacterium]|nr:matrixin family metalloprotease [bacterium]